LGDFALATLSIGKYQYAVEVLGAMGREIESIQGIG
jgi:hypothetical protein